MVRQGFHYFSLHPVLQGKVGDFACSQFKTYTTLSKVAREKCMSRRENPCPQFLNETPCNEFLVNVVKFWPTFIFPIRHLRKR